MIKQDEYQEVSFKYFTLEKHKSRVTTSADLVFSLFTFIYVKKKKKTTILRHLMSWKTSLKLPSSVSCLLSPLLLFSLCLHSFLLLSSSTPTPVSGSSTGASQCFILHSSLLSSTPSRSFFLLLLCAPVSVHLDLSKMLSYKVGRAERTLRGGRLKNLQRADAEARD